MLIKEFNSPFVKAWINNTPYGGRYWTSSDVDDDLGMYLAGGEL